MRIDIKTPELGDGIDPAKVENKKQISVDFDFKLPDLGDGIDSAEITKVLVKVGDIVEIDQVLIEIETDKATVEIPSESKGTVIAVNIKEGDTAKIGDSLIQFKIETPVVTSIGLAGKSSEDTQLEHVEEKRVDADKKQELKESVKHTPREDGMPIKAVPAAPSVRKFAREIGISIYDISGTGPGGRISIEDVKTYSKFLNENGSSGTIQTGGVGIKAEVLPNFTKWGKTRIEKMSNVRRKTAEHLSYAWSTIPHVTQFDKADITEFEKMRKQYSANRDENTPKLTATAFLLKIIAGALKEFPNFNASIDLSKKEIIYKDYFNVGIAVDTERGLLVPVLKNVDEKDIIELSAELTNISQKARNKKLTIDDMQGGNFTISNLGGIGGTAFTPIVNSPEVAILGVSRGSFEPVYNNGNFEPRLMLPLSLSYDHRIIDGADAARFIRWVALALENPFLLALKQ